MKIQFDSKQQYQLDAVSAVVDNDQTLYRVRETKSTYDFLKLRTSEADKVKCGQKHFEAIGVPFAVVVSADEV